MFDLKEFAGKIKSKLNLDKDKSTKLFLVLGLAGILLIGLSSLLEGDSQGEPHNETTYDVNAQTEKYKESIEKELSEMLSEISGVGKVRVMVTIESTTEYVYAEELSKDNSGENVSYKNQYVILENSGEKEALVKKIIKPEICGVAVACEGGDDLKVSERIIKTVSAVLDISSTKICVVPLAE